MELLNTTASSNLPKSNPDTLPYETTLSLGLAHPPPPLPHPSCLRNKSPQILRYNPLLKPIIPHRSFPSTHNIKPQTQSYLPQISYARALYFAITISPTTPSLAYNLYKQRGLDDSHHPVFSVAFDAKIPDFMVNSRGNHAIAICTLRPTSMESI